MQITQHILVDCQGLDGCEYVPSYRKHELSGRVGMLDTLVRDPTMYPPTPVAVNPVMIIFISFTYPSSSVGTVQQDLVVECMPCAGFTSIFELRLL